MKMPQFDFRLIREINPDNIEIYTDIDFERNSSLEIENCINETLKPVKVDYRFDLWFDDNDTGYFKKEGLRVDIHYGVMTGFIFYVNNNYTDLEISKIENWIEVICKCMLIKEEIRLRGKKDSLK